MANPVNCNLDIDSYALEYISSFMKVFTNDGITNDIAQAMGYAGK